MINTATVDLVKNAVVETLGIEDRADSITEDTGLFASMPEFDSLAIVELIAVLEERFGFEMDEDDITADVFATVGSLSAYVDEHRPR